MRHYCVQDVAAMTNAGAAYNLGGGGSNTLLQPGYRIEPLNRLAFPKGKIPNCEISGQAASVACITPHITLYYATEEQAEQAWHGKVLCNCVDFALTVPDLTAILYTHHLAGSRGSRTAMCSLSSFYEPFNDDQQPLIPRGSSLFTPFPAQKG